MAELELSPPQAARIASWVYNIQSMSITEAKQEDDGIGVKASNFSTNDDSLFKGVSGIGPISKRTGFGYIAEGVGTYKDNVLVAIRGTDSEFDILTDINAGTAVRSNVHIGFSKAYESFAPQIADYFRGKTPRQVHVVGHSLGGALATLAARQIKNFTARSVKLYSFGCPRVGTSSFATELTGSLGPQNIYRVHHNNDPVTMIPIWPFYHVPKLRPDDPNPGYWIGSGGPFIYHSYHFMKSYREGVAGHSWTSLANATYSQSVLPVNLERWLDLASASGFNMGMFSAAGFKMIAKCLTWLIRGAEHLFFGVLATGGYMASTAADRIAYLLHRAVTISKSIARNVKKLIVVIFKWLGRGQQVVKDITASFLRWVLELIGSAIGRMARLALGNRSSGTIV